MPRWQQALFASCAGVIAFALAYAAVDYAQIPRFFHYQHEHALRLQEKATTPAAAGYVGLWTWALVAMLIAGGVAWFVSGLRKQPARDRSLGLAVGWALTAVALSGAYFTWHNWP